MKEIRYVHTEKHGYCVVLHNGEKVPLKNPNKVNSPLPDELIIIEGKYAFYRNDPDLVETVSGGISHKNLCQKLADGKYEKRGFVGVDYRGRFFSFFDNDYVPFRLPNNPRTEAVRSFTMRQSIVEFIGRPLEGYLEERQVNGIKITLMGNIPYAHVSECVQDPTNTRYYLCRHLGTKLYAEEVDSCIRIYYWSEVMIGYIEPYIEGPIVEGRIVRSHKHKKLFKDRFVALNMGYFEMPGYPDLLKYCDVGEILKPVSDAYYKVIERSLEGISSHEGMMRMEYMKGEVRRLLPQRIRENMSNSLLTHRASWKRFPRVEHPLGAPDGVRFKVGMEIEKEDFHALSIAMPYAIWYRTGWYIEKDGSLDQDGGYELISPPMDLSDLDDIRATMRTAPLLNLINARSSNRCGGHIHLSDTERSPSELFNDVSGYFPLLYAMYSARAKTQRYTRALPKDEYLVERHGSDKAAIMVHRSTVEFRIFPSPKNTSVQLNRLKFLSVMARNPRDSFDKVLQDISDEGSELFSFLSHVYDTERLNERILSATQFAISLDKFRQDDRTSGYLTSFEETIRKRRKTHKSITINEEI